MNSLKDYSVNISEEEYHNYPAWSYSTIAKYAKDGFSAMKTLHDRVTPTPSMEFGSLFDAILTHGRQVENEYVVCDITVPDAEKKALDYIASRTDKPHAKLDELSPDDLMQYCDECQYQGRWGYDARLKHLLPFSKYYDMKMSGKAIVSKADWDDAIQMATIFRKNPYLSTLFGTKNTKDVEYLYQTKFIEDYVLENSGRTVKVKIMPDLLVVNHKNKTVQPVDLKTSTVPGWGFKENFLKYRYDIQAHVYSDILAIILCKNEDYREYTILPYLFTDISRSDMVPVTYRYPQFDPSQIDGLSFKDYKYKGWEELLDEIITYEETEATVPSYIVTDGPNDLLDILNK